jgi:hypothetical protein
MADDWGGGGDDWGGGGGGGGSYDDDDGGGSVGETSHKSWFQRVMDSFVGAVIGIVLFLASFVILFWNEGRAVNTARALEETDAVVKEIKSDKVDASMDGKVVHMTGKAVPTEPVKDDKFGIEADAIKLSRSVEMFQWRENTRTEKKKAAIGGKETTKTIYTYEKVWSNTPINSANFKWNKTAGAAADPDDEFDGDNTGGRKPRVNPPWPDEFKSASFLAAQVKLGAYTLSKKLVEQISGGTPLAVNQEIFDKLPGDLKGQFRLDGGSLYKAAKADGPGPHVGDLRVAFNVVNSTEVSIIAEQTGETFRPFQPKTSTNQIEMLAVGNQSAKQMVTAAQQGNVVITWIIRLIGFLCMAIGFYLVLNPIAILTDFLPFISTAVGFVLGLLSFLVAVPLTLITIAIAWVFYRPMLAFALLGVAAVVLVGAFALYFKLKSGKGAAKPKSKSRGSDDGDDRPRNRRPADDDADDRPRKRRPADDDADDDRPRRRRD